MNLTKNLQEIYLEADRPRVDASEAAGGAPKRGKGAPGRTPQQILGFGTHSALHSTNRNKGQRHPDEQRRTSPLDDGLQARRRLARGGREVKVIPRILQQIIEKT